jgi:hypothetical protein
LVFKTLEESALLQQDTTVRGEKAFQSFLRARRRAGESMQSFIARLGNLEELMSEKDKEFQISERMMAQHAVEQGELTKSDKLALKTHCAKHASQGHGPLKALIKSVRDCEGLLQGAVALGKEILDPLQGDWLASETQAGPPTSTHAHRRSPWKAMVAIDEQQEEDFEDEESMATESNPPSELDSLTHDVHATYKSAKMRLTEVRKLRGYYKKSTKPPLSESEREQRELSV